MVLNLKHTRTLKNSHCMFGHSLLVVTHIHRALPMEEYVML